MPEYVINQSLPGIVFPSLGGKVTGWAVNASQTIVSYTGVLSGQDQTDLDAAVTAYPAFIAAQQAQVAADAATYNDLKNGVVAILNRLDAGIAAVATDKTDLVAAGNLAQAKAVVDRMLNRENALYTDLKKVIKRLEILTR